MKRRTVFPEAWMYLAPVVLLGGCSSEDTSLVTVAGTVVNIDTQVAAPGVVVSLLDQGDAYASAVTGADGLFTLRVPKGSPFELVTNDWGGLDKDMPPAPTDDYWITLINVEPALPVINDDIAIIIHACPTPDSPYGWKGGSNGYGSVAVWKNFMANSTTRPDYTDATDVSGKMVVFTHSGTPPNMDLGFPLYSITGTTIGIVESSFGKFGYWDALKVFNTAVPGCEGLGVHDASRGPDMFVENGIANGPGISASIAFGNQGYTDDTVTLTFTDTDAMRNIDYSAVSPLVVPVRDRATTMVTLGSVDNRVATITEGICATGRPLAVCQ